MVHGPEFCSKTYISDSHNFRKTTGCLVHFYIQIFKTRLTSQKFFFLAMKCPMQQVPLCMFPGMRSVSWARKRGGMWIYLQGNLNRSAAFYGVYTFHSTTKFLLANIFINGKPCFFLFRNLQQINMFPVRIKVAYIKYHALVFPNFLFQLMWSEPKKYTSEEKYIVYSNDEISVKWPLNAK